MDVGTVGLLTAFVVLAVADWTAILRQEAFRRPLTKTAASVVLVAIAAFAGDMDGQARAAIVASGIERFDPIDVETILNAAPAATRRIVAEARKRYLRFAAGSSSEEPPAEGPMGELAARAQGVATRAFSISETS